MDKQEDADSFTQQESRNSMRSHYGKAVQESPIQEESNVFENSADFEADSTPFLSASCITPTTPDSGIKSAPRTTSSVPQTHDDNDTPKTTSGGTTKRTNLKASMVGAEAVNEVEGAESKQEERQFQQVEVREWELTSFKANLKSYLDNDFLDANGEEEVHPIRSVLIKTGEAINVPCTFLLHFFMSRRDKNQNSRTQVNPASDSNPSKIPPESLYLEMKMTLVESPAWATTGVFANYRVSIVSEQGVIIGGFGSKISKRILQVPETVLYVLNWGGIQPKLDPNESIFVDIQQTTYANPSTWGLDNPNHVEMISSFMLLGSIKWEKEKDMERILKKCEELKLFGILECYNAYVRQGEL